MTRFALFAAGFAFVVVAVVLGCVEVWKGIWRRGRLHPAETPDDAELPEIKTRVRENREKLAALTKRAEQIGM